MHRRILGKTGIKVSEISFGTASLGIAYGIGVKGKQDMLCEADAVTLLQSALDKGLNFFDTARAYGRSEELLGKAFRSNRQDVVICTKCAHLFGEDGQLPQDKTLKQVIGSSLEQSLSALKTDYIDIYMLHDSDVKVLGNETVKGTLSELEQKGLVRAIGVSTYTCEETQMVIEDGIWDVVQLPYNLMDQRQGGLLPLARQRGVGIVVRSALFKGVLTNKGDHLHPQLESVRQHRQVYDELLGKTMETLPNLAMKFVLSHEQVSSVLVGIDRNEYLENAAAVADGKYLDERTLARAKELAYPEPQFLDLRKWYVLGWLK